MFTAPGCSVRVYQLNLAVKINNKVGGYSSVLDKGHLQVTHRASFMRPLIHSDSNLNSCSFLTLNAFHECEV
jgi:hypothetical protein